jgi:hypothetical protein
MAPRFYEVMSTERDKLAVKSYAEWLGKFPWQIFSTFTFAWRVSDAQADKDFMAFINEAERQVKSPVAFVRGDEKRISGCGMPESHRHYHVLLTSLATLDPNVLTKTWWKFGGSGAGQDSAKVEPCHSGERAAAYCLKFINQTEGDWKFRNLDLFLADYHAGKDNYRSRRRASRNLERTVPSD